MTPSTPLSAAQRRKLMQLNTLFSQAIAAGYTDAATGITMSISDDSLKKLDWLTSYVAQQQLQPGVNLVWGDATHFVNGIIDMAGAVHPITIAQFNTIIQGLSITRAGLEARLANRSAAVMAATTIPEVNAVVW